MYRARSILIYHRENGYDAVLASKRHRAVGKESTQTSHIERTNNTLRQRLSRLVRKTLSFSKKQANHERAIWYYIHHHNATIAARRALITTFT